MKKLFLFLFLLPFVTMAGGPNPGPIIFQSGTFSQILSGSTNGSLYLQSGTNPGVIISTGTSIAYSTTSGSAALSGSSVLSGSSALSGSSTISGSSINSGSATTSGSASVSGSSVITGSSINSGSASNAGIAATSGSATISGSSINSGSSAVSGSATNAASSVIFTGTVSGTHISGTVPYATTSGSAATAGSSQDPRIGNGVGSVMNLPNGVTLNGYPLTEVFTQGSFTAGVSSGTSTAPLQTYKWLNPGTGGSSIHNYTTGAFANPNILAGGDSITASGSDRAAGPVQPTYAMITGSVMNVPLIDVGLAGENTTSMVADYPFYWSAGMPVNTGVPTAVTFWAVVNDILNVPYTTSLANVEYISGNVYRDQGTLFLQFPTCSTNAASGTVPGMSGTTGAQNYVAYISALQGYVNSGSYLGAPPLRPDLRYNPTFMAASGTATLSGSETATITTVAGSGTVTIGGTTTGGFFVGQTMASANLSGTLTSAPYVGSGSSTNYQIILSTTASSSTTETGSFSTALYDNVHPSTIAQADWAVIYQNAIQTYPNYIIPVQKKDVQYAFKQQQTTVTGTTFQTDPDLQVTAQPGAIYKLDFDTYVQPNAGTTSLQVISSGSLICNLQVYSNGTRQTRVSNGNVTPITTIYSTTGLGGNDIQLIGTVVNDGTAPATITLQTADSISGSSTYVGYPGHVTLERIK